MGRELKRVPLDFRWPYDQLWKGYVNPFRSMECKSCDGGGLNPETKKIYDDWYNFGNTPNYIDLPNGRRYNDNCHANHITQVEVDALVERGRLYDLTHEFISGMGWIEKVPKVHPTCEQVNEWNRKGFGHDAINRYICVEALAKERGVYGECEFCNGKGEIWQTEEIKSLHEQWQNFDPPTGEGFQLWTTTSEGSPMTPVFASLDELCQHCEDEKVSVFGDSTATKEKWMQMLSDDFVSHQEGNMIFI